ncbi:MAG: aspartate kinase [Fibrobacterales bacterium]|nr:aspartate kinase [Fibrobacterales bacterium]
MIQNPVVCKFGGSSMADAGQVRKVRDIVLANPDRAAVVVSAPGKRDRNDTKLTDLLYAVHETASRGLDFSEPFGMISDRYLSIARELGLKTDIGSDLERIREKIVADGRNLNVSWVVSRGEFLCARLMAEFLGWDFVDAFDVIEINSSHRVSAEGYAAIAAALSKREHVVVPGFYARNALGELETFSRGGSDITGAILANALDARVYENWTDVSGLLMADPRIVDDPRPMPYVSYREIRELSYSGANVLHDESIAPCKAKGIPINIRNTNRPQDEGTVIGPHRKDVPHALVTGIAGRKNFSMIYIDKDMMNKERGFGARAMGILEGFGIPFEHAPTGIDSMSIIVDTAHLKPAQAEVLDAIERQLQPDKVRVFDEIALVATVGHGMTGQVGVAAKLFGALAAENISVRVIDQGSSEINIIVGVDDADYDRAIRAIYAEFVGERG